jgi:uncharacterized membrane protein YhaH (DUF805 family)
MNDKYWGSLKMDWMFLPFSRYAEFSGRSCRAEYWMFALLQIILIAVFLLILGLSGALDPNNISNSTGGVMMGIFGLIYLAAFLIPGLAVTVRRWHDLDQSGWFLLLFGVLGAIPIVGILASLGNIIWFCLRGTEGSNKYGDDPLA